MRIGFSIKAGDLLKRLREVKMYLTATEVVKSILGNLVLGSYCLGHCPKHRGNCD